MTGNRIGRGHLDGRSHGVVEVKIEIDTRRF